MYTKSKVTDEVLSKRKMTDEMLIKRWKQHKAAQDRLMARSPKVLPFTENANVIFVDFTAKVRIK